MFKICFHRYEVKDSQPKYEYLQCSKCGRKKTRELFKGGYQPMKYPNWTSTDSM